MSKYKLLASIPLLLNIFSRVSATCELTLTTKNLYNKSCVIGKDCSASDNGYYLIDNTLLKYTYSDTQPNCITYSIPLPGYYLNQKATGDEDKYIQCNSFNSCSLISVPTERSICTDENEGQLILGNKNKVQLCTKINYYNKYDGYIELINTSMDISSNENSEDERYIIRQSNNDEVFNFDSLSRAKTYYVVKKDDKSIVFDPQFNAQNSNNIVKNACANISGLIMDRMHDYCNFQSSGMYYNCVNGKCNARYQNYQNMEIDYNYYEGCVNIDDDNTCYFSVEKEKCSSKDNGYYYHQDSEGKLSVFKFTYDGEDSTCELQENIFTTKGYYWNDNNYKDIIKCNGQSCQPEKVESNPDLNCNGYDNKIIDSGFNLVFCGYNSENFQKPLYNNEEDSYFTQGREISGVLFDDSKKYYAIKSSDHSLILDETVDGNVVLDKSLSCIKGECSTENVYGYILTNSKKLNKCDENGCTNVSANIGYYLNAAAESDSESLKLIKCDRSKCDYINSVSGFYLNAAYVNDTKNLIKCTSEKCKGFIVTNNGYYLSSEYSSKLIKCDDNGCAIESQNSNKGYYLNVEASKASETKTLIKCSDNSCGYSESVPGFYVNAAYIKGTESKNLIKCTSDSCLSYTVKNNGYYLNNEDSFKLIKCDDNECAIETQNANKGYYLNAAASKAIETKSLIKCSDNGCGYSESVPGFYINAGYVNATKDLIKCTSDSCENYTVTNNGYYLSNEYPSKLIKCDDNKCAIETQNSNKGYYLNAVASKASETKTLIKCSDNGCDYSESVPGFYINAGYVNRTKDLIKCTSDSCESYTVTNNGYYLSNEYSSKLIKCDDNGCAIETQNSNKGYYLNAVASKPNETKTLIKCSDNGCGYSESVPGFYINAAYVKGTETKNLIKCTSDSCVSYTVTNNGYYLSNEDSSKLIKCDIYGCAIEVQTANEGYYLNADALTDSDSLNLINCSTENGCTSFNGSTNDSEGYIDASSNTKIIICDADGCTSNKMNTALGGGLIDASDNKKIITCDTNGCTSSNGNTITSGGGYVDIIDNTKIITCNDKECSSSVGISNIINYYINNGIDNETNKLIECSNTNCSTKEATDGYYIYKGTNKLIHCASDGSCVLSSLNIDENSYKYYINNGNDKKTNPLIECSSSDCSAIVVPSIDGYYLHGGSDGLSNALIQCSSSSYCKDPITIDLNSSPAKYYLNSGADKESKGLIECSNNGCSIVEASEGYYLSSGNNSLIYCNDNKLCGIISVPGYYKNSASYVSGKSKAIIKCEMNNTCSEINGVNGYYINSAVINSLTNALIKCDDRGCDEMDGKENYYANNNGITAYDVDALIICKNKQCISSPGESDYAITITKTDNNSKACDIKEGATFSDGYYLISEIQDDNPINSIIKDTSIDSSNLVLVTTEDDVQSCKVVTSFNSKYFININSSSLEKGLIVCSDFTCHLVDALTGYYLNGAENVLGLTNALINCNKKKCSVIDGNDQQNVNNNGMTVFENDGLIECKNNQCTLKPGNKDYAFTITTINELKTCNIIKGVTFSDGYYLISDTQGDNINSIIRDTNVKSSNLVLVKTENQDQSCKVISSFNSKFFVNANENSYGLIKCSVTDCELVSSLKGYYLNGSEYVSQLTKALIKCDESGCSSIDGQTGYYINNAVSDMLDNALILCSSESCSCVDGKMYGIYLNKGNTNSLIQCSSNKCLDVLSTSDLYGTNDNPYYYINSSTEDFVDKIIKCKNTCEVIKGDANTVYLNGNLKTEININGEDNKPLIICISENVCNSDKSTLNKEGTEYYLNGGSNTSKNLIQCIYNSNVVTCKETTDSFTNETIFYINGNYARDGKYLIKCTDRNECNTFSPELNIGKEYYPHGGYDSENNLKNAIIQCNIVASNTQNNNLTAICSLISESKINDIYINASDMKLIKCSNTGCSSFNASSSIEYYVNAAETYSTSYTSLLIKCSQSTCKTYDGSENAIFINGNSKVDSSTGDNLIRCVNGKCNVIDSSSSENKPSYYINAALTSFSDCLIKCTENCITISGTENGVYLNGNYNLSTGDKINNLIICSSNKCKAEKYTTDNSMNGYYINAGALKNESSLIKCTINGCVIENINDFVSEVFFINKNYNSNQNKYLIKCTSGGCENYENDTSESGDEFYIHGAASDLTNSIIKCTKNDGHASCNLLESTANNHVYINAYNSKLIRCSGMICSKYDDISNNVKYYVNAANLSDDSYTDLLIKCNNGSCNTENGKEDQTYPNGNYNSMKTGSGDFINNIIICGNNICTATKGQNICLFETDDQNEYKVSEGVNCNDGYYLLRKNNDIVYIIDSKQVEGTLVLVTNDGTSCEVISERSSGFFINAYGSSSIDRALIWCDDSKCNLSSATDGYYINSEISEGLPEALIKCANDIGCSKIDATNGYYINNAVSYSIVDSLIKCDDDGCNTINGEGSIYLNNGVTTSLNNALISCNGKQCSLINGKDGYYLNSGGSTFETDILIKCENNKCSSTSGSENGYFINNAVSNSLKNGLIICDSIQCNLATANANDIYLYAMENNKLIQCLSIKCSYLSKVWENDHPSYYRNSAIAISDNYENQLIICNSNGCSIQNGEDNHSYDNGNYDSNGEIGDKSHQGILCRNRNCELVLDLKDVCIIDYKDDKLTISTGCEVGKYYVKGEETQINENQINYNNCGSNYCSIMDCNTADSTTPCNKLIIDGYMIINNVLTLSNESGFKVINTPTDGNYMNSGFDKYSKPLIRCEDNVCQSIEVSSGYYINAMDQSKLISMQCSDNSSCSASIIDNPEIGYYSGGGKSIKCNGTICEESNEDDQTSDTKCDNTGIGKLLKGGDTTMFCIGNGISVEYHDKEAYYFLDDNLSNSIFGNNVLVKTGNNALVKVNSSGMFEDKHSKSNIKCSSDSGILKIICRMFNLDSLEDKQNCSGEKGFIKKNNKLNYCPIRKSKLFVRQDEDDTEKQNSPIDVMSEVIRYITMEIPKGEELPFRRRNADDIEYVTKILKIGGGHAKEITTDNLDNGVFINGGDDLVEKPLTKCTKNDNGDINCANIEAKVGYYLNALDETKKTIIKCDSSIHCITINPTTGYYLNIDENENMTNIKCSGTCDIDDDAKNSNGIIIVSGEKINLRGGYINSCQIRDDLSNENASNIEKIHQIEIGNEENIFGKNNLVLVKSGNGALTLIESKGYFINDGEDKNNYPIIKCISSSNCQKISIDEYDIVKTSCSKSGVGNLLKKDGVIKYVCLSNIDGSEIDITDATETYYLVTIKNENTPFGDKDKTVLIKSGRNEVIPVDLSSITSSGYYLNSGNDKDTKPLIYCSNPGSQISCSKVSPSNGYYLNIANNKDSYPLIQCSKGSCSLVDVSSLKTSCGESSNGSVINILGYTFFCPTTEYGETVKLDKTGVHYYVVTMSNEIDTPFFGGETITDTTKNVLVKIEKDSITAISSPIGYYINAGEDSSDSPIIKCLNGVCEAIAKLNNINEKTSCDQSGELIYDTTEESIGYKFCYEKGKSANDLTVENYYFMAALENEVNSFSSFTESNYNANGIFIRISEGSVELIHKDGYYVDSESKLILCKNKICNRVESFNKNQIYINAGVGTKPIIKCIDEHSCEVNEGTLYGYYFNYGDGKSLIYCESTSSCSNVSDPIHGYYKNSGVEGNIIKCDENNCVDISTSDKEETGNVVKDCSNSHGGNLKATNLYLCSGDDNHSIDSIDMTKNLYYLIRIGAGNTSPFKTSNISLGKKNVLVYSGNGSLLQAEYEEIGYYKSDQNLIYYNGESPEIVNVNQGYYLNAGSDRNIYPIIYCDGISGISGCVLKSNTNTDIVDSCSTGKLFSTEFVVTDICLSDNDDDKVEITNDNESYYLLTVDNSENSNEFSTVLTGQVNPYEKKVLLLRIGKYAVSVVTTSDSEYYINSGKDASEKPLIYCTSTTCTATSAHDGDYFVNAVDKQSLIYCESSNGSQVGRRSGQGTVTCSEKQSSLDANGSEYYLNGGEDKTTKQVIKCTYSNDKCTCATEECPLKTEGTEYYLNSGENKDTKQLIQCTFDTGDTYATCKTESSSLEEAGTEYYLNGDEDRITKQLIKCTLSDGITCTTESSSLKSEGIEYYVNGDKTTPQLIKCTFASNASYATCSSETSKLSSNGYEYYLNNGSDKGTKPLIKCVKTTQTTSCSPETINSITNSDIVVYINGATSSGTTNSLIECCSTSCEIKDSRIKDGHIYAVYMNSDAQNTLVNALIKCNSDKCTLEDGKENESYLNNSSSQLGKAIITCDGEQCKIMDANNGDYYVNSDTTNLTNGIIICSNDQCLPNTTTNGKHYVNSANNKLSSAIISCVQDKCTVIPAEEGHHYLNDAVSNLTNAIITCDNTYCTAGTANENDYYINNAASDLTTAIITCDANHCYTQQATNKGNYINSSVENLTDAIITCGSATCTAHDAKPFSIYINSDNNGKLIQCLESSCGLIAQSGTDANPKYYINAAIEKDNEYAGLLIKCNSSQKCSEFNGSTNGIYLNGNSDMDTQHPLIRCLGTKCEPITNTGTNDDPIYYVNTLGESNDAYSDLLIKCASTCTVEDGAAQSIYLNANYNTDSTKGDAVNELIQCLGDTCKAMEVTFNDEPLYYINGGKTSDVDYTGLLIKCTDDTKCRKVDGHIHAIYLNANYNSDPSKGDNAHKLIQCIGSSCQAVGGESTEDQPIFYINAGTTAFNKDSLIVCRETCTVQKGTNGDIYLNGNYHENAANGDKEHPLIICSDENCTSSEANVGFYLSTKDKVGGAYHKLIECDAEGKCVIKDENAGLGFYVSALDKADDKYPKLIECTQSNCERKASANDGFYISGKDNKMLIKCNDENCEVGTGNAELGFYFSALDKAEDKYLTLIECTQSGCERKASMKSGYYISGYDKNNGSDTYTKLIQCAEDNCYNISATRGYYLNSNESESESYPIIRGNSSTYEKIQIGDIGANCESTSDVGNLMTSGSRYYLCIEKGTASKISLPLTSTSVYYYKMSLDDSWVFGDSKDILVKFIDQSIVPANTTIDADDSNNVYINNSSDLLSDVESYNQCNPKGSVTRFTLSGTDQSIVEASICNEKCYPASISPYGCNVGYYLIDDKSAIINTLNKEGTLYYCDSSDSCSKVPDEDLPLGYLRNADYFTKENLPYFACSIAEADTQITCKSISVTATNCAAVSTGSLITTTEENGSTVYKICIQDSSSEGISLDPTDPATYNYFLPIEKSSIFNQEKRKKTYIIIDLTMGSVVLHPSTDKLHYLFTNNYYKIFNREDMSEEDVNYCKNSNNLHEFELVEKGETINYYKLNK